MARGETFSGCRENGALAPGPHPCLTGVEVACVARNKVSRWVLPPIFLLTVGQPLDIFSLAGIAQDPWFGFARLDEGF